MKKWIAAWTLLAILAAVTACAAPAEQAEGGEGVPLYYLVPEDEAHGADRIRARKEHLGLPEDAGVQEQAAAVVLRLLEGPPEGDMRSPFPPG